MKISISILETTTQIATFQDTVISISARLLQLLCKFVYDFMKFFALFWQNSHSLGTLLLFQFSNEENSGLIDQTKNYLFLHLFILFSNIPYKILTFFNYFLTIKSNKLCFLQINIDLWIIHL